MKLVIRLLSFIGLLLSIAWLATDLSWEPSIVAIGSLVALLATELKQHRGPKVYDYIYDVSNACDFYDAIAPSYDTRNSELLLKTHREVIAHLEQHLTSLPSWSVLDLGAGTGMLIAHQFASARHGKWTAVDWSREMTAQFRRNMQSTKLPIHTANDEVDDYLIAAHNRQQHDAAIVSLLLSSMRADLSWPNLAQFVKPGGILIVADIDPGYAANHRHFALTSDSQTHALLTRLVHSTPLVKTIQQSGFCHRETELVQTRGTTVYSYVCVFERDAF